MTNDYNNSNDCLNDYYGVRREGKMKNKKKEKKYTLLCIYHHLYEKLNAHDDLLKEHHEKERSELYTRMKREKHQRKFLLNLPFFLEIISDMMKSFE